MIFSYFIECKSWNSNNNFDETFLPKSLWLLHLTHVKIHFSSNLRHSLTDAWTIFKFVLPSFVPYLKSTSIARLPWFGRVVRQRGDVCRWISQCVACSMLLKRMASYLLLGDLYCGFISCVAIAHMRHFAEAALVDGEKLQEGDVLEIGKQLRCHQYYALRGSCVLRPLDGGWVVSYRLLRANSGAQLWKCAW